MLGNLLVNSVLEEYGGHITKYISVMGKYLITGHRFDSPSLTMRDLFNSTSNERLLTKISLPNSFCAKHGGHTT